MAGTGAGSDGLYGRGYGGGLRRLPMRQDGTTAAMPAGRNREKGPAMIGLRRQVRASVASVLAGTASVLQMAAGVAETVAQELRLTLDADDRDGRARPGASPPHAGHRSASAGTAGRALGDVTGRAESRRLQAVDTDGRTAAWEEPPFAPGASSDVGGSEGEAVPPPRTPQGNGRVVPPTATGRRGGATTAGDEPPPWVDDVAASVAGGTVREATARLPELTATQLRAVERYERSHAGRVTLLRAIDAELADRGE